MDSRILDLTGQRFGKLIVVNLTEKRNSSGNVVWRCQCDCGNFVYVASSDLIRGQKSCGCEKARDITGIRSGRLVAVKPTERRNSCSEVIWLAKCDCGNFVYVAGRDLTRKHTKSCGCLSKDIMSAKKGHLNNNWNPKLTDEERVHGRCVPGYSKWRFEVFERDGFTCQKCGDSTGGNLNAHHIDSYADNPESRVEISNGVTLCEECHKDFHHIYGNHSTREKVEEWLDST